jgi:hypothetical protein
MNADHVIQRLREKSATLAEHCPPASNEFSEMADTIQATLRELEHTKADLSFVNSVLPVECISDGLGGVRKWRESWEEFALGYALSRRLVTDVRAALGIEREAITPADAVLRLKAQLAELQTITLWCVHVQGPDTLIAQPDHEAATKRAVEINATIEQVWNARTPSEFDPLKPIAVVALWPYTPTGHAESLAEHGGNPEEWC